PAAPSAVQRRLWFLDQLDPGSPAYNLASSVELLGALDPAVLEAALAEVVRRHEPLRSRFPSPGGEPRVVVEEATSRRLSRVDLTALDRPRRRTEGHHLAAQAAPRPFDLARGPLLRAILLRRAADDHVLFLGLHHIVSDAWSQEILFRELSTLYEAFRQGRPSPPAEPARRYGDYAAQQARWLESPEAAGQLAWWCRRLEGIAPVRLPVDRPRRDASRSRGARCLLDFSSLPPEELRRGEGSSLFMTLLAGFFAWLGRVTGQADLVVGVPAGQRPSVELEELIGPFVNSLVLRAEVPVGGSFDGLLAQVRETVLDALARPGVPFERLVDALAQQGLARRDLTRHPLFQISLVLQNAPRVTWRSTELRIRPLEIGFAAARFDLELVLWEEEETLRGVAVYDSALFDAATVGRWTRQYVRLLGAASSSPSRPIAGLALLSAAQRHQLLHEWSSGAVAGKQVCLHRQIALRARRTPGAPAVVRG
ncbi:MAG: non-ribosomal peptide synthetase, partial [bacterium]|nr:non-ribosomal peptide synthetase [bacterium]